MDPIPDTRKALGRRKELTASDRERIRLEHEVVENNTPLINPRVVDLASQRLFIVSAFVLIQCLKVYDVIALKSGLPNYILGGWLPLNNFTFIIKYALADGIYLWMLPLLNVPYLQFSPFVTLMLTILANITTFILASDTTVPIILSILTPFWNSVYKSKEMTIGGDTVVSENFIDINSHFKGRYVINYLPDSSAHFNPFKYENLCLELEPEFFLPYNIPIEFNTTNEVGFLQLEHKDQYNEIKYINFTHNDLTRLLKRDYTHLKHHPNYVDKNDPKIFYIEVPLPEPGSYKISTVQDVKGMSIRTYKLSILLLMCPLVKFMLSESYTPSLCRSKESFDKSKFPKIDVFGVAPLKVKIESKANGKKVKIIDAILNEVNATLVSRSLKDLSWLKAKGFQQEVLQKQFQDSNWALSLDPGMLEFHILEITDSLGHTRKFNPSSKDPDIYVNMNLIKEPKVKLKLENPGDLLLINSTKKITIESEITKNDFPLEIVLSCPDETDPRVSQNKTIVFDNLSALKEGIPVKYPGKYSIISGSSKLCPCEILSESSVEIKLAPIPSVKINAEAIIDKCVGSTGYDFRFEFSGRPPFQIAYQVYQEQKNGQLKTIMGENGSVKRYLKSLESTNSLVYKPPKEGKYLVVFNELKDLNYYSKPLLLDDKSHTYLMYLKQRSRAYALNENREAVKTVYNCLNGNASIPLFFKGNYPFKFTYQIIDGAGKIVEEKTEAGIAKESFDISSSLLSGGGEFQVKIFGIEDGLSCPADYDESIKIKVKTRTDVPEIEFDNLEKNKTIKLIEGQKKRIPIKLHSSVKSGSEEIGFTFTGTDGSTETRTIHSVDQFYVEQEGTYQLISYSNGRCPGRVLQKDSIIVEFYDRPELKVESGDVEAQVDNSVHLNPVCQNCEQIVYLKLKGVKPFVVDYEVILPSGSVQSRTVSVEGYEMKISLHTDMEGRYQHKFKNVYDSLYTRENTLNKFTRTELAQITYSVNPLPSVLFEPDNNFVMTCESNVLDNMIIPVSVKGSYPLNISLSITHESSGKVEKIIIDDVTEPRLNLQFFNNKLEVGSHVITVDKVVDGNGCTQRKFSRLNNYIVKVTEVPTIEKDIHDKNYYCVGDHISYSLSGFAPFTVYYHFNDKLQRADLDHSFKRLASKPGNLSIAAISDSSPASCLVNFTNTKQFEQLQLEVHDLPSVEINQGDYIIRDIYEGDQTEITFTFLGTPPFRLKYTRSIETAGLHRREKRLQVVETHTVKDIWEDEHTIRVNLEGTYDAIEIEDFYCLARRYEDYVVEGASLQ